MSKRKFYRLLPIFLIIILGLTLIIFTSDRESLDDKREHFNPKPKIKTNIRNILLILKTIFKYHLPNSFTSIFLQA